MHNEPYEDDLNIDIEVCVVDGVVTNVRYKGEDARARVYDFDVQFPCVAAGLQRNEDGEFYTETVV